MLDGYYQGALAIDSNDKYYFENLYRLYYAKMVRFAKQYVLSDEDAENIAQDTYSDVWERWSELHNHPNHLAFLLFVVKNKCIDFLRRKTTIQNIYRQLAEQQKMLFSLNLQALEQFGTDFKSENDIATAIQQALNSLPARCRDIFYKSKIEGKKHKDIAREMDISINTIETQMTIAYRKLREELKDLLPLLLIFFLD
ncbi:MAG: RNA polymerase sigma-70 factor [Prevotellaceae bacterium]|nr:RNA polymerase sigma-70 factor [Prevotellaceae bacterium]